ncbi:MAG: class I SAM-dependent methyltransferase [Bacteroidota bacterium]
MIAFSHRLSILSKYIKYRLTASDKFDIHSPFIYDFYTRVVSDETKYKGYKNGEDARLRMLSDERIIEVTDYGTGGRELKGQQRKVRDIARKYACNKKDGALLFRITQWRKPESIIELGTSVGIGSAHLKSGNQQSKLITIEGCPNTAAVAAENFRLSDLDITVIVGNIDDTLEQAINLCRNKINLVYFDGNHTKEATISYFCKCRDAASENAIFVFGDIHWSAGMEEAWDEIKKDSAVKVTIDLFHLGIVFFSADLSKQDFVLKY